MVAHGCFEAMGAMVMKLKPRQAVASAITKALTAEVGSKETPLQSPALGYHQMPDIKR